jgi:acyl-CoA thioesterase-2
MHGKGVAMSRSYPILSSLALEQTGESSYRGPSVPSEARPVVFGGQLMGQMIVAASASMPGKTVRSLHAIFARAGTVTEPVDLDVDVMHSGRALGSLSVTARQGTRLLSRGLLLLDAGEPDLIRHSDPMPAVAGPEETGPPGRGGEDGTEEGAEARIVDGVDLMAAGVTGPPELHAWARFSHAPDDQAIHQALVSWYTDPFLIGAAMRPHDGIGQGMAHDSVSTGVLTHTLSFHEPVDATTWLLLANRSIVAGHGRTYGMGQVFDRDGRQVASYVQDAMVRAFRNEPAVRGTGTLTM